MKPAAFIQGLLADVTRSDVVEDAALLNTRVSKYTITAYNQAAVFAKSHKTTSRAIIELETAFDMGLNEKLASAGVLRKGGKIIENIDRVLPQMLKNIETVAEIIEKSWNEKAATMGITYRNANLLQFVSLGTFVDRYARAFLNYYFICETVVANPQTDGFAKMTKSEIAWINNNAIAFGAALSIVGVKTEKLTALIDTMPDMTISIKHSDSVEAAMPENNTDPLQMSFIPAWINPIYAIRMKIVDWQVNAYNENKADLQRLQLRKLFLEESLKGKRDLRVENELEKTHERISELQYKIAVAEERTE